MHISCADCWFWGSCRKKCGQSACWNNLFEKMMKGQWRKRLIVDCGVSRAEALCGLRIGGLRINFEHLGIFKMRRNCDAQALSLFASIKKSSHRSQGQTCVLELGSTTQTRWADLSVPWIFFVTTFLKQYLGKFLEWKSSLWNMVVVAYK